EPGDVLCGLVGRLVWEKGYREVFAAAAQLRERVPNLRFAIIGPSDPDKADAVSAAAIEAVERLGNGRFLGSPDDVDELYAAMDMLVLASRREGFPRTPREAAAMGLPVIATDIRGCRQAVDHGRNGLLVPLRDVDALSAAIEQLATDADVRARMGAA